MDQQSQNIQRLAQVAAKLAPEHGRTTYGEPGRFATPMSLYDRNDAQTALDQAAQALRLMRELLQISGGSGDRQHEGNRKPSDESDRK